MPPCRPSAVLALSFLLVPGPISPAGRTDDPPARPTTEQRQALQRQAVEHFRAGQQAYRRDDLPTAVEETRQTIRLFERLYPRTDFPAGHSDLAFSLHNMGLVLRNGGDLDGARGYFERALAMYETLYPRDRYPQGHPLLVRSVDDLGSLLQAQGDYGEARRYFKRALEMCEAAFPGDRYPHGHLVLATSLNNLGTLLQAGGDYDGALGYLERAERMNEALYPRDRYPQGHPELATSLNNLGSLLQAREDYDGARACDQRALAMREALYPMDRFPHGHPELAGSLNNLGDLLRARGDYGGAREYFRRSLAMFEALYPRDRYPQGHPHLATGLNNLGSLLRFQGDYDGARGYYQRALAMREALYPRDHYPQGHPDMATSLNDMGSLLQARGDYDGARDHLERTERMNEALYPRDRYPRGHPDLATSLNHLGSLLRDLGDYAGARGYYERAMVMNEALYPRDRYPQGHSALAATLNQLGSLLQTQGDYGGARGYYERSLAMFEALYSKASFPRGHPALATSLNNLGSLLLERGDLAGARRYLERALVIREALYPRDRYPQGHPELATSLNNLGSLLGDQRDYDGARAYFQRALMMKEALYSRDRYPHGHAELAKVLNGLGYLLQAQEDYDGARRYYERALAMREALYPRDRYPQGHPELAASLNNLGVLFAEEGRLTDAWPLLQQAVDMYQDLAELVQGTFSEAESEDYLASLPGTIQALLDVSCRLPEQAEATYARVWRNKAAVARIIRRRQAALTLRAGADADTRRNLDSWLEGRRRLARLLLATSDGRDDPGRIDRLRRLTAEKERLERELAAKVPEITRERTLARSPHARLTEALPAGTVVLDLVAFNRSERDPKGRGEKGRRTIPGCVGFVLAVGQPVRQVDLGPAQPIEEAVHAWRAAIANRQPSPAAEVVRRAVWEPLARHFPPGTTTVLVAPDWLVTGVPWAALPGDRPGTVLLEQYAVATIPHAPFLLDRLTSPARSPGQGGLVLAIGGVDYDGIPRPGNDPAARTDLLALRPAEAGRRRGGSGDGWKSLPGTSREVEAVAKVAAPRSLLTLRGTEASTTRLLVELPTARWAHIATHGFFASPDVRSILQPDPRLFALEGRQRATGLRNPLVLSGLVLAGANGPADARADRAADDLGIITAEAIAGLPLQDLELAVLSACDTGLGGIVGGGEGVFGLQRAFHLAGAHNVVASLWKVDDEATAALMAIFYDQLWRQNKPPIEALRAAQLMLYRDPTLVGRLARARGTPDFDKTVRRPEPVPGAGGPGPRRADAKDWAAFVLSGWGR